jgi:outer membrane protein assembly factor BamB
MGVISDTLKKLSGKKLGKIEKKWVFDASSSISSSPISAEISKGQVGITFGTNDGRVYMLGDNAKIKWFYSIQEKIDEIQQMFLDEETAKSIYASPTLADINQDGKKEVLFGCDLGKFYALNYEGKLLWDFKTDGKIRSSALVQDNMIIFGSNDKNLYALNAKGKLLWKFKAKSGIESSPAVLKGEKIQIIFGSNDGFIYSINTKGKLLWEFKTKGKITAKAAIGDIYANKKNYIIIGSADNNLYVLDEKGKLEWMYETEGGISSQACLADINNDKKLEIIFGSCDDNVYCLSCNGGKIWNYETDFWIVASPLVIDIDKDGKLEVIVGSYDNSVYILDAEGTFLLDYMPGVSGVTQQPGHYNDLITAEPGKYVGKKLWQYKTEGMIIGSTVITNSKKQKEIIVGIKNGKLNNLTYKKD